MKFFSVLFALLLHLYLVTPLSERFGEWGRQFAAYLRTTFDANERYQGALAWGLAVVPALVVAVLLYRLSVDASVVLGWVVNVAGLYCVLDMKRWLDMTAALPYPLRREELVEAKAAVISPPRDWTPADGNEIARISIENALIGAHRGWFGVVFWFTLLPGPSGALLYWLAALLAREWTGEGRDADSAFGAFARRAFYYIDGIPATIAAGSAAIVGNFEEAVFCWRSQSSNWPRRAEGIVLSAGAGAMGVRLGGPRHTIEGEQMRPDLGTGDEADADAVESTEGLLWRAIVVWVGFLLLLAIIAWVGR
jgi:adenosylcobinamide-phosphate synthase